MRETVLEYIDTASTISIIFCSALRLVMLDMVWIDFILSRWRGRWWVHPVLVFSALAVGIPWAIGVRWFLAA